MRDRTLRKAQTDVGEENWLVLIGRTLDPEENITFQTLDFLRCF